LPVLLIRRFRAMAHMGRKALAFRPSAVNNCLIAAYLPPIFTLGPWKKLLRGTLKKLS
jgi:hypothetical protein